MRFVKDNEGGLYKNTSVFIKMAIFCQSFLPIGYLRCEKFSWKRIFKRFLACSKAGFEIVGSIYLNLPMIIQEYAM